MLYNENNLLVAKMASKNDTRPELASVLFTKEKTVATDSFRLLEVTTPSDAKIEEFPKTDGKPAMRGFKPFMVPAQSLKEMKNKGKLVAVKHVSEVFSELMTDESITRFPAVSGHFPDYEQIFPKGKPVLEVSINPEMFGDILLTVAKMMKNNAGSYGASEIRISFYGELTPVVVEAGTKTQKIRGLIMPIRK